MQKFQKLRGFSKKKCITVHIRKDFSLDYINLAFA